MPDKPGFGRVLVGIGLVIGAVTVASQLPSLNGKTSAKALSVSTETYRLIQARGNVETESGRGLSKSECERQKKELKAIGEALGTYNEKLGIGSITCLPESVF